MISKKIFCSSDLRSLYTLTVFFIKALNNVNNIQKLPKFVLSIYFDLIKGVLLNSSSLSV